MLQKFLKIFFLSYSLIFSSFAGQVREIGFDVGTLKTQGSTPSNPAAGKNKIYVKDGEMKLLDSVGTEKSIGSSTSNETGVNILANKSFEEPVNVGWTYSGGTFTQQSFTNASKGDLRYARFVATASGQYFETVVTKIPDDFSGGCQADFKKLNVSGDDLFKVEVLDSSLNVLTTANVKKSSWQRFPTISFVCPTSGSEVKLRVTALAAGTIEANHAYLGSNQNLVSVSQAKLVGTVTITGCAAAWVTSSVTLADFPAQTGCTYTTTGEALAPTTNIPGIRFANLEPGDYKLELESGVQQTTSGKSSFFSFFDGTNYARESSQLHATGNIITPGISQSISYSAQKTNVTLSVRAQTDSGGVSAISNNKPAVIKVWYFPTASQQAVNTDQASWFIDANMGGANPSLGTANVTSYTSIDNGSLDLVINTAKGSAPVEIACASGTSSSGLNCGGVNESVGIAFTPPSSGIYEACYAFSHNTTSNGVSGGSRVEATFQLVETPNSSTTILQEGGQRTMSSPSYTESQSDAGTESIFTCGTFTFSDTSKKTLRLMYEQSTVGSPLGNILLADRSASIGQRDIKVTVRPLLSAYNRPILTGDQVTTRGANNTEFFSVSFGTTNFLTPCTSSSCLIDQIGNSVSSIIRASVGDYTIYFTKTYSKVKCNGVFNNLAGTGAKGIIDGATNLSCSNCNSLKMDTGVQLTSRYDTFGTVLCHAQP